MGAYQLLDTSLYFTADLKEYLDNSPDWKLFPRPNSNDKRTLWRYYLGEVDDHTVELDLFASPNSTSPIELVLESWGGTTPVALVQEAATIMMVVQALSSLECTDCGGSGEELNARYASGMELFKVCRTCKGTGKKNELWNELTSKSAA